MIHELKTKSEFFAAVASGEKSFEIREHDRPYEVGDFLGLNEWDGNSCTGRCLLVRVSYILFDPTFCKSGFCVMGLVPCGIGDGAEDYRMMCNRRYHEAPIYDRKLRKAN